MTWVIAATVWVTLAAGVYLVLSRDALRAVVGLSLLGAAANLVLLAAGRVGSARPAIVPPGQTLLGEAANPLPQALVLTAIVIGFALVCFAMVLLLRLVDATGTDDTLALREAEPPEDDPVKPPPPRPGRDPDWPSPEGLR